MAKYLLLWEIDTTKVPVSPKERGAGWKALMEMVKQDMKKGMTKDWGAFVGEINGYSVAEGTEVEIGNMLQQFAPFVRFKVHPIASVSQVEEVIKALTK
jgi:hypothetical protein